MYCDVNKPFAALLYSHCNRKVPCILITCLSFILPRIVMSKAFVSIACSLLLVHTNLISVYFCRILLSTTDILTIQIERTNETSKVKQREEKRRAEAAEPTFMLAVYFKRQHICVDAVAAVSKEKQKRRGGLCLPCKSYGSVHALLPSLPQKKRLRKN